MFICQGTTCIFILRRSPPFSAPGTKSKWLFNTIQRHFCAKVQMERINTTTAQQTRQGSIALALQSTTHEQILTLLMRNKKCHYWHMDKCTIQQPRGKILPLSAFLLFRSHSQQHSFTDYIHPAFRVVELDALQNSKAKNG